MAHVDNAPRIAAGSAGGFAATERKDAWWVGPLLTALGLGGFVVYATFRAIYNGQYSVADPALDPLYPGTTYIEGQARLLSPFYSPCIVLGGALAWISPAFLILWAPGGFRVTCYYYRKAYYRAFFLDPAGCAVGEPGSYCGFKRGGDYKGETRLLLFQNLHRYFLYFALAFLVLLFIDFVEACMWPTTDGHTFGFSIGSLVLLGNFTLLSFYTLSCHSFRHLIGGGVDCFSRVALGQARYTAWKGVSVLNKNHMLWAWTSLFMVAGADLYVWLVASGTITDIRII